MTYLNFDAAQKRAIELFSQGVSFALIGSGGTGKSTVVRAMLETRHAMRPFTRLQSSTEVLKAGNPAVVVCSWTRQATAQIKAKLPDWVACSTLHRLLEYRSNDELFHGTRKKKYFPTYTRLRQLPPLESIIIDEATMHPDWLEDRLRDALSMSAQWVFAGDLWQLTPVGQWPMLGKHLNELPFVELTTIYRQKGKEGKTNTLLDFIHGVRKGDTSILKRMDWDKSELTLIPMQPKRRNLTRFNEVRSTLHSLLDKGAFNPREGDFCLAPHRVKGISQYSLAAMVAEWLDKKYQRKPVEIWAGKHTLVLAEGDVVSYNKDTFVVESIHPNGNYAGITPDQSHVSRYQDDRLPRSVYDAMIAESCLEASHFVQLRPLPWAADTVLLKEVPDFEEDVLYLNYGLTVHKAQGSQAKTPVVCLFDNHAASMLTRELAYTAVSRAQKHLVLLYTPSALDYALRNPEVVGETLEDKIAFIASKETMERPERLRGKFARNA